MKLSVLIPYRPDSERRKRIYEVTREFWDKSGLEVVYASDGLAGPFSYARAINAARKQATGDWLLSYSVDALPPSKGLLGLLDTLLETKPWAAAWRGQQRFTDGQTESLLRREPLTRIGPPTGGISIGNEAVVAVRAAVWDILDGYDERFVGWGPEDRAWHLTLKTLFPDGWDQPTYEFFRTLWHPVVARAQLPANVELFKEYQQHATDPAEFERWYFSRPNYLTPRAVLNTVVAN